MIHYFYGTLQVGIGQTLCSFEHVSCCIYDRITAIM